MDEAPAPKRAKIVSEDASKPIENSTGNNMSGFKRDRHGNEKKFNNGPRPAPKPKVAVVRNAYTPMFEQLRDELDAHHDRRDRLGKASRDVTGLSKKIVRTINPDLPPQIQSEVDSRLAEISKLLATMAPDVQGINRYRYSRSLMCLEELAEALTFAHYLKTQTLLKPEELSAFVEDLTRKGAAVLGEKEKDNQDKDKDEPMPDAANVPVPPPSTEQQETTGKDSNNPVETEQQQQQPKLEPLIMSTTIDDYFYGVFDLSGEMMRFATTSTALTGKMAGAEDDERTIVEDMHELGSFFEMLPTKAGDKKQWEKKLDVMRQSVRKVERLGYDRKIRGSERPKGWVPDLTVDQPGEDEE
ncbi:Translin family-domain-containing protein [Sordaria brevicollis]|uniref:Translin family-domain-containing protein n=1 Tax=Sordaria brevicollis TaxID=83679 RepID=A0AAE0P1B8_SORBR|nr:Translin family-domain-containing protein [Sordaria brevicollis]